MNAMTNPISLGAEGIYRDIPNEIYHGDRTAVSSSSLKLVLRSPAHFIALQEEPEESTVAKDFGTALHSALLEPEKYRELYVAKPTIDKRTKSGKALAETIAVELAGKMQISPASMADIEAMVSSARKHPRVIDMLKDGEAEVSYVWKDEATGILCKCRPDWLNTNAIFDLKSCLDASPEGFSRACAKYKYHVSAAFYVEGVRKLTGKTLPFQFVASEKDPPYAVAVYEASEAFLRSGRRLVRQALDRLHECRERGAWPSYQPDGQIEMVELPRWAA
jgi:PDDEXK-like domain of unknown function (DUF3799)